MTRRDPDGNTLKLALVIHNHQPIGNFDFVVRQACEDSYRPFLELFERHASLRMSLHISGSLLDWLLQHDRDYVDRVRRLVRAGRIELLGGPQYEPILAGIPRRDRIGQIRRYLGQLEEVFGTAVRGMWTPERVWEPSFTADVAEAGIAYTVLDDYHFLSNGVGSEELIGYFVTEDQGRMLRVFPGNERLRYLIPFRPVTQTIALLRAIARRHPGATIVFADDGEKFGTWPGTREHVYQRRWLERFFRALERNGDWVQTVTLKQAVQENGPVGHVQLPECSYREMTEWAMPAALQLLRKRLVSTLQETPFADALPPLLRGASWRNFRRRYEEANEMYSRMRLVSERLDAAVRRIGGDVADAARLPPLLETARDHLYRAQCNCPYWHGAFGGLYLPFLRTAIYRHLILADRAIDDWLAAHRSGATAASGAATQPEEPPTGPLSIHPVTKSATPGDSGLPNPRESSALAERTRPELPSFGFVRGDFDADGRDELRIRTAALDLFVAPHRGGQLYELDVLPLAYNVLATMDRRQEAYHEDVREACRRLREESRSSATKSPAIDAAVDDRSIAVRGASARRTATDAPSDASGKRQSDGVASIHEAVRLKRPDLDRWLAYDRWRRKGLVDHFVKPDAGPTDLQRGRKIQGAFATAGYRVVSARVNAEQGIVRIRLRGHGTIAKQPVTVDKQITLRAEHPEQVDVTYRIGGVTGKQELAFVSEFNVAGLAADADDRYFECRGRRLGRLAAVICESGANELAVVDEWLGLRLVFATRPRCDWWTFPICTVNGSESGYELVQQSSAVAARWLLQPDERGGCRLHWSLRCENASDS